VVNFDFEITLLTVSAVDGVHFCARSAIARKMAITANPGSRSR
jgi:formate-dependent phosphoribosylglycinamide formyltransferase (GAR transformylase)